MRVLLVFFSFLAVTWGQATIIDYLRIRRYTQLLHYIDLAGLTATLNGTANYTLFAPSNTAFYRLPASATNDTAKLADVLKYHVVSGSHKLSEFNYNEEKLTSLQGSEIRVNRYLSTGRTTVEGQPLGSERDVSNGVVYLMYNLMMPPTGTVLDVIANDGNLTTLRQAIQTAGLDNFFKDQNPITLFAPTDKAFSFLGQDKVAALLKNPDLLASILKYHVIPGTLYAAGYHPDYMHTFEEDDRLRLNRYISYYEVEGVQINRVEQSATNGVVHQINEVLIPNSLADQVKALTSGSTTK